LGGGKTLQLTERQNGSKTKFTEFTKAKFSQHIILIGFVSFCLFLQNK